MSCYRASILAMETAMSDTVRPVPFGLATRLRAYGSWALVTGASSGIGRAAALRLAEAGVNLVLVARSTSALAQVATAAEACGVQTRVLDVDLGTTAGAETVERATAELDVGLFVAAAGFGTSGPFGQAALEDELAMLDLNCRAVLVQTFHFARRFRARRKGGILLFSSLVGWHGTPGAAHYAATKAYVQVLAEGIAPELAGAGVDVLAVAPGPVATGFAARADMRPGKEEDPDTVALAMLASLGRRRTVVPGGLAKLLTYSLAMLPRRARIGVLGSVMGGMTKHQHDQARQTARLT
jgi:short-subunit dehydrogenase